VKESIMAGLFTNDLFNGEALGGPWIESDRGIFRANLFDAQPLGQTTPDAPAASGGKTAAATTGTTPSGGKTGSTAPSGGKTAGTSLVTDGTSTMPAAFIDGGATEGEFPWVPVALVGGGLVLTVGAILLFSGKKSAPVTSNRRRRRRR
jgi:hypothetical protein